MKHRVLKVHPSDNVLVALTDLLKGERIAFDGSVYQLQDNIKAKHKFAICDLAAGPRLLCMACSWEKRSSPSPVVHG